MSFPKNSSFPRNSPWTKDAAPPSSESRPLGLPAVPAQQVEIGRLTPPPTLGSTQRLDVTEVPHEVLERWYRDLDEILSRRGGLRSASFAEVSDRLEELRDQLYSYLR